MKAKTFLTTRGIAALGVASSFMLVSTAFAAPGKPYSDEWLSGRISGALAYNPGLDSSDIDVASEGGNVTLSGKVPSEIERDFAEQVAKAMDGVSGVKNELKVDESLQRKDRASFSQKLSDAMITASVKSKLLGSRDTHAFTIDVDTSGNVVTLNGKVASDKEKAAAEKLAFSTSGVREVRNQLTVEGKGEARAALRSKDTPTAVSDAWISTKARSVIAFDSDFNGSDIDVTTTNGIVRLDGFARTPEQKKYAETTVADLNGVKSVENRLAVRK